MRFNHRYRTILFLSLSCWLSACSQTNDPGTGEIEIQLNNVTDLGIVSQDGRVNGRDGGYSGNIGNRQIWVFGDTAISEPNASGSTFLSSSYSLTNDVSAADGIEPLLLANDSAGLPLQLFEYTEAEVLFNSDHQGENCLDPCGARWALWPGPVIRDEARQRSLIMYGKIKAAPGEFNFFGVGQSIAIWEQGATKPSRPNFNQVPGYPTLLFGADEPAFGPGTFSHEYTLYSFACQIDDLVKPCKLARVPLASATDKSTWQYYGDDTGWSDSQQNLSTLFHGNDIMSVSYNEYLQKFVAVYSEPLSRNIKIRTAPAPEGPWSNALQVTQALDSGNTNGWVYDALAHPEFNENNGSTQYITYTRDTGFFQREMRLLRIDIEDISN